MTIEEIQKECRKRFPVGCTVLGIGFESKTIYTIQSHDVFKVYNIDNISIRGMWGFLYYNGEFAEVVSYPENYNIEKNYKYLIKYLKKLNIK